MEDIPLAGNLSKANRQIARGAATVMLAFAFGQLIGLGAKVLIAGAFGTGMEADAFYAANRLPDIIFQIMAGGALASAFVPTFTGLLARGERESAWKLASSIANLIFLGVAAAASLAFAFAPQVVRYLLAPKFASNPQQFAMTVTLLRIMLPSAVIFSLSGLLMGVLNSHQIFLFPALAPSMYTAGQIFGVLALAPRFGVYGLAWGVLAGSFLHLVVQLPALLRLGGRYAASLGLDFAPVREVGRLMAPRLIGVGVVQLNFWLNTLLASGMAEGSLAGINLAMPLMLVPEAVIAQSIAIAAMPTFSAQVALGQMDELRASLAAALRAVLLLAVPASLGLVFLRRQIVALLYQHGAFDAHSTELVAWALLWYAIGLVGHSVIEVVYRAFYSLHDTRTPVFLVAAAMSLNLAFSLIFSALFSAVGWAPHGGLALANSLATALEMAGALFLIRRRVGGLQGRRLGGGLAQAAAGGLAMSLALAVWLSAMGDRPAWLSASGGIILGVGVYALAALVLRVPELYMLLGALRRQAKKLALR